MNDKFFDLKKEKQDRMINAALKVFALRGYRHASTDDIVKEAGISKGLLFHYFENKLGVYEFIYEYSVRYMMLELSTVVKESTTDMFELMKQVELARMNAMKGYPYMQMFLNRVESEDVSEALMCIYEKKQTLEETYANLWSRVDFEGLRPEVDALKVRNMLELTIQGLMSRRFVDSAFRPEMLYEEIAEYIDMMKKICKS